MDETIWVMDSDLCEYCNSLLGYFGQCPNGCDLVAGNIWWDEDEDDEYTDFGDYDERAYLMGEYDE